MSKVKKIAGLLVIGFVLVNFIGCSSQKASNEVVAKVNGKEITRDQLDKSLESQRKQLENINKGITKEKINALMKSLEGRVLESIINREIILQEAEKQGAMPTDKEIDGLVNSIIKKYGSKEKFEAGLKKSNSSLTVEEYRQMQKERLAMTNLFEKVTKGLKVDEKELKKYYNQNKSQFSEPMKTKRILIKFDSDKEKVGRNEADALKKAQSLINRIKSGADISALARENSDELMTKDLGGDFYYNPLTRQFTETAFINAVKTLKPGGLTAKPVKVISTKFSGFYIIKYISPLRQKNYEEAKDLVAQRVLDITKSDRWQEFNKGLIKSAKIEKYIK